MKTITLPQFLTKAQITKAAALYAAHGMWDSVAQIQAQVIEPNLSEIDAKLGQANDARYLAYTVVYALSQTDETDEERCS
jgi:hypothetical protein